ncbi:DUF2790 domain-containing protein [Azotobacter chroococcum]|nr:DUF2790 domain-containing protein [Azotobacter chroococcum]
MKSAKTLFAAALFSQAPLSIAESTTTIDSAILEESVIYMEDMPPIEVEEYNYGMELDIADVINVEYFRPEPYFCGAIPAQMVYEDSEGEINAIRYLYPDSSGCSN